MKSVFFGVFSWCFFFLSTTQVLAFTYDGTLNPNEFYTWEWKVFDNSSELGVDLVKAKNPKKGGYPTEVTLIVMREAENILFVKNQIVGYFYGDDLKQAQFFFLDEERNHFKYQVIDLSEDEVIGKKKIDEESHTIGEGKMSSPSE